MKNKIISFISVLSLMAPVGLKAVTETTVVNEHFSLKFKPEGIVSLKHSHDAYDTDYIMEGQSLGDVLVRYRVGQGRWQQASAYEIVESSRTISMGPKNAVPQFSATYDVSRRYNWGKDLEFTVEFGLEGNALYMMLHFRNLTDEHMEIGDIALSFPFNTDKGWDRVETETRRVGTHSFVSGNGSFIFWMRPNSLGPYLVMTPLSVCPSFAAKGLFQPTKLEYFEGSGRGFFDTGWSRRVGQNFYFIHSAATGSLLKERGGTWRQPHTSIVLAPMYSNGWEVTYGFKFRWAGDYDGVREVLFEEGLFDVHVVPGMTVPEDLEAMIALRTRNKIKSITPEFPEQTKIESMGERQKNSHVYRVKFSRLGENVLTVMCEDKRSMVLEFFVTEPLEVLIKKRAEFLTKKQARDSNIWYDGLILDWDMRNKTLITPDDNHGVGWGDWLCKGPYIAAKNFHFPSQKEIEAVDYYIKNYVWGKLQLTDKEEPLPYGIYGVPGWRVNRESKRLKRPGMWEEQVSRAYDYPHMVLLYFEMYRIAKNYPDLTTYLEKDEYLNRAFGTAKAYFTLPYKKNPLEKNFLIDKATAQTVGMYNELIIVDLIEELYANGKKGEADWLKKEWEKKVEYFVNEDPNLWASEFAFDPTGFESTHAFARYALQNASKPDSTLEVDYEDSVDFMERQTRANVACRGWLGPAYYLLGSAKSLNYASQIGGWSIVDYALHYSEEPEKYLRLGYASFLSSWAVMNSGRPETDYGFWYPGEENDGGAGGGFIAQSSPERGFSSRFPRGRGPTPYSFEMDIGYLAALRTAATIMVEDPVFGLFAYGGQIAQSGRKLEVIPRDGLRKRFHIIRGEQRFHMILDRDGFAKDQPIIFDDSLSEIRFSLESRSDTEHKTSLRVSGLKAGTYDVLLNGVSLLTWTAGDDKESASIQLPIGKSMTYDIVIRKMRR